MKSTIHMLTLIVIYSRILIFTTLYSIKPEFRAIRDIHEKLNKYSQRALLNPIFH